MAALSANRPTQQYGGVPAGVVPERWYMPVEANTTIYQGSLVEINAAGNAIPAAAATAGSVLGRSDQFVANTTAAGFGAAAALSVTVRQGAFLWDLASGAALTKANFGQKVWAASDHEVDSNSHSAAAGMFMGLDTGTSLDSVAAPQAIVLTIGVGFFGTIT
jgi:hypothetical protein